MALSIELFLMCKNSSAYLNEIVAVALYCNRGSVFKSKVTVEKFIFSFESKESDKKGEKIVALDATVY